MKETESTLSNIVDPRFNDELYGFDKIEKMFLNVIRNEKLSNAYIFYGIKGVGKATFAFRLARFILNEDKKFDNKLFISKDNKIFKSVSSLNHPDFILIDGNNGVTKTISADLLKTIQSSTYKTSIESKYKVIIIDSIDDITKSSSTNTLLKSLEDAPKSCIFKSWLITCAVFIPLNAAATVVKVEMGHKNIGNVIAMETMFFKGVVYVEISPSVIIPKEFLTLLIAHSGVN